MRLMMAPLLSMGMLLWQPAPASNLLTEIKQTVKQPDGPARDARAVALGARLDRLPDTELDTKIEGHFLLEIVDATAAPNARWLIDSAKSWNPALRKKYASRLVDSYLELAEILAADGKNDEALSLVRRVPTDLPEVQSAPRSISGTLARLELIGKPAAPLTAPRWLNLPSGQTALEFTGKVTLIEFSAHWCAPCTQSYPALNRFRAQFGAKGFQTVIATELYGYFGPAKSLSPDAELARDRAYFTKHLPGVPVAIGDQVTITLERDRTIYSPARDPNNLNYRVGGLPQFYLIDRQGRVRYLVSSFGRGSEATLKKLIQVLIAE
jgi:hypothetical protein